MINPTYSISGRKNLYQLSNPLRSATEASRKRYNANLQVEALPEQNSVDISPEIAPEATNVENSPTSYNNRYLAPDDSGYVNLGPSPENLGMTLQGPNISPSTALNALKISKTYGPMTLLNPQVALPLAAGNALYNALGLPSISDVAEKIGDTALTLTDAMGLTSPSEGSPRSDSMLSGLSEKVYNSLWGSPSVYSGIGGYYNDPGNGGNGGYDIATQGVPSAYSGIAQAYGNKKTTSKDYRDPFGGNGGGRFGGGGGYF